MSENDILQRFMRVRLESDSQVVEVAAVFWHGSHTPEIEWIEAARMPLDAGLDEIDRVKKSLLANQSFFVPCNECRELVLKGRANNGVCHRCMERNHGVVF